MDVLFCFFLPGGGCFLKMRDVSKKIAVENKMDMVDGLKDSDNHK